MTYRITKSKGEYIIKTEGVQYSSMLENKKDIQKCLTDSIAHQQLLAIYNAKQKTQYQNSASLPSTVGSVFVTKAFLTNICRGVENLVNYGIEIEKAIALGNSIANCEIVSAIALPTWITCSDSATYQLKNALSFLA